MFCARLFNHNNTRMLNICDADLLGRTLNRDNFSLKISQEYYTDKVIKKKRSKGSIERIR